MNTNNPTYARLNSSCSQWWLGREMVSVCKLGGTINQTGVKGGKSKRSQIPPQSLSFSFSPRPRFSRFAAHRSPLDEPRDVRSIALKTLGKERDCLQSTARLVRRFWVPHLLRFATIRQCTPFVALFETIRTIRYSLFGISRLLVY